MSETTTRFREILVITDDQTWIWSLASGRLEALKMDHVRLPSNVPIRQSWDRFKDASRILVHWEAKERHGGAVIEEILDVQPSFDVGERIVVLTTNPTHEDVVYFAELGVRRIVSLRNRDKDLARAGREIDQHVIAGDARDGAEIAWRKVLYLVDTLPDEPPPESLQRLEEAIRRLRPAEPTARYLDADASLLAFRGEDELAIKGWHQALDKNPNYYRSYHNLIRHYRRRGKHQDALKLMQKMHELNKSSVARLVGMGEIQLATGDQVKAEFYFQSALDRDQYCSGALNGLAEIRFHQGDLDESRRLLARSHLAYKAAQRLNMQGIDLVRAERFEQALDHYTRAQYVLPQQDKGPLLFYNIGLCYSRWGKLEMARQFLRIAVIKEPNYKKARKLLDAVEQRLGGFRVHEEDVA